MAFGETKKQLAAAQAELDEYRGLGVYIDLAKELQARVTDRLSRVTETDLNAAFSHSVSDVEDELVQKGIAAKLKGLPAERLLGMYAARFGDDSVNQPLKQLADLRRQEAERQLRLEQIKREVEVSRQFDFRHVDEGEIITIGLFKCEHTANGYSRYRFKNYTGRAMQARVREQDASLLEVLSDEVSIYSSYQSSVAADNATFKDHSLISIGTVIRDEFEPVVTQGTTVAMKEYDGTPQMLQDYDLGYIVIGGTVVLGA